MTSSVASRFEFGPATEPASGTDMRNLLTDWLDYQRHEFQRKLRDLSDEQLAEWSVPPVQLSVLGLIRHMTQMEHVYLSWGLAGGERQMAYGDDDYAGGDAHSVVSDVDLYLAEVAKANAAIAGMPDLESPGAGHGSPLGATLIKMVDEYALHSGQAHMLRFAALGRIVR